MKIDVRPLRDGQSIPFSHALNLPPFDRSGRVLFPHPVTTGGSIYKRGGILVLEAAWQVWAEFRCDRCDAPFSRKLSGTLSCVLAENGKEAEAYSLGETARLDGGFCDVDEILTLEIILSVESKNLCLEDCQGNPNWRCFHHGGSEE